MLLLCTLLLCARAPYAAGQCRLSVLYFDNLSGKQRHSYLSKALTELLIQDLSQLKGLALVERQELEKVTGELALGLTGLVDETTSPKLGKMLGATHLLTGAFRVSRGDIAVMHKLIAVEDATVVGAGNAEGKTRDLMAVKAAVSASVVENLAKVLPDLKASAVDPERSSASLEQLLSYGEALTHKDNGEYEKARTVLKSLLGTAPSMRVAKSELADIDRRIAEYDKRREQLLRRQQKEPLTFQSFTQVALGFASSLKYTKLLEYCIPIRKEPPQAPEGSAISGPEYVDYYIVLALYSLKRWSDAVPEAERFLKLYPTSMYYGSVKLYLTQAANEISAMEGKKRRAEEKARPLLKEAEAATGSRRSLLYFQAAMAYFGEGVHRRALECFRSANLRELEESGVPADNVLLSIFMCYYNLQDRKQAEKIGKTMESFYPDSPSLQTVRTMMSMFPE
jgi:TolB-like protein